MKRSRYLVLAAVAVGLGGSQHAAPASDSGSPPSGEGKLISVRFAKTEISAALRMVAEQGGLNVVVGPDVTGDVSMNLENVPVTTALRAIAVHNGFACTIDDNVISVSKPPATAQGEVVPPLVTRVFALRCQNAHRVKEALEHTLSKWGKMTVLNEDSSGIYASTRLSMLAGDFENGSGTTGAAGSTGPAGAANAANPAGAAVMSNPNRVSQTLVVTDVKENVERIVELIADLDVLPPQVLIEARIVEMSTDLERRLGIDWNLEAFANGPILNHEWPLRNRAGFATGGAIRRDPNGTGHSTTGLSLGTIDFSRLSMLLEATQTDTSIRLLANPRLLVFNNHSANILVGERYPIFEANITDFGTVTESFDTYIPIGVQLEVTPTILADGRISMMVHPATSALGDDVIGTTGLRVARIRTRELDTRVIMRDGQTIVLGGLISDRKIHVADKVPGLGDWPILSIFFRQERPESERVDLLVFLTARVEGATRISERDRQVFEMYRPHFKHVERLQDVPLHFEIPTEYEAPRPMFSEPPEAAPSASPAPPNDEWYDSDSEAPPATPEPPPVDLSNERMRSDVSDAGSASESTPPTAHSKNAVSDAALTSSSNGIPLGDATETMHDSVSDDVWTAHDQAVLHGVRSGNSDEARSAELRSRSDALLDALRRQCGRSVIAPEPIVQTDAPAPAVERSPAEGLPIGSVLDEFRSILADDAAPDVVVGANGPAGVRPGGSLVRGLRQPEARAGANGVEAARGARADSGAARSDLP